MSCWKCDGQVVNDRCTLCGCVQSTRKPAETDAGKALRYVYDKFGARRTLTEDGLLFRCLADVLPLEPELRKGIRAALNGGIGRELFHLLESNTPMDANARIGLRAMIEASTGIMSTEMLLEVMNALLDMVGFGAPTSMQKNTESGNVGQDQTPKPKNIPSTETSERSMHPNPPIHHEQSMVAPVPLAVLYHVDVENVTRGAAKMNKGTGKVQEHHGVLYLYSTGIAFHPYKHAMSLTKHAEHQESPELFLPIDAIEQIIEHDVLIAFDFTIVMRNDVRFWVSASTHGYNRKDTKAFVEALRQKIH